ncbi:MAG: Hsp20/alpha crystallin family protein [Candidatus Diapherotrites archaeon]
MGEWKKRKDLENLPFDFEKLEDMMDELMDALFEAEEENLRGRPAIMGFSIRLDSEGNPKMQEFGNIAKNKKNPAVLKAREPLVDLIYFNNDLTLTAEMPGVERGDLEVNISGNEIELLTRGQIHFYKRIAIDRQIKSKGMKISLNNGIVEIKFRLK